MWGIEPWSPKPKYIDFVSLNVLRNQEGRSSKGEDYWGRREGTGDGGGRGIVKMRERGKGIQVRLKSRGRGRE